MKGKKLVSLIFTLAFTVATLALTASSVSGALILSLKADTGITKDANDYVSVWADQSGEGNNAVQSNGSYQPKYIENVVNGKPVVGFDGVNDYMVSSGVTGNMDTFTVIFMINPASLIDYNQCIGAAGHWGEFLFHSTADGGVYVGIDVSDTTGRITPSDGPGAGTLVVGQWDIFSFIFDNGSAKFYENGILLASKTLTLPADWTGFKLGHDSSNAIDGDITEVFVYNGALSDADRQSVEQYLQGKYGIGVTPTPTPTPTSTPTPTPSPTPAPTPTPTPTPTGQTTYYVAPDGDDNNPGTLAEPFATITKARDTVRTVNDNMTSNITVYLREGVYAISSTIVFNDQDSGTNGYKVIYKAYPDEKPVISGGEKITGWTDIGGGIYRASAGTLESRQLYVDGARRIRAREPDTGYYSLITWDTTNKEIDINSSEIADWDNFTKVEMVARQSWAESYMRLQSYSVSGSTASVKVQTAEEDIIFPRPYPPKANGQKYHFENAYEFLDTEGEWYINTSTDYVYYKPYSWEDMSTAEVIAPKVETLVKVEGTSLDYTVEDITFYGITFEHSTYLRPNDYGYLNMQAGQYNISADPSNNQYCGRPAAGVYVAKADRIRFERNTFRNMGATGLDLHYGTHYCEVIGNVVMDIAGNGICVAKFTDEDVESHTPYNPSDTREIDDHNTVKNNYVYKVAQDYYGCVGIGTGYPRNINIEHNLVKDTPYTGVSVGWGWTSSSNAMEYNFIAYNEICEVTKMLHDGGGIYTLSLQPGTQLYENYIYNVYGDWMNNGIFNDEASGGTTSDPFTVEHNVMINIAGEKIRQNATGDITYINNNTEDQTVIDNAGIESEYEDIIPPTPTPTPTPTPEPTVLVLSLKADVGITKDADGYVSAWADQSGEGNNAVQATSSYQPKYIENVVNGKPVVRFDGVNDYMVSSGVTGAMNAFTVIFMINPASLINWNQCIGAAGHWGEFLFHSTSDGGVYVGTTATSRITPGDGPGAGTLVVGQWDIFSFVFDNGSANFYENGTLLASKTLTLPADWTGFKLGDDSSNAIDGDITEIFIYKGALSDADRENIEQSLQDKYAL